MLKDQDLPLFWQSWYLDIVAPKSWRIKSYGDHMEYWSILYSRTRWLPIYSFPTLLKYNGPHSISRTIRKQPFSIKYALQTLPEVYEANPQYFDSWKGKKQLRRTYYWDIDRTNKDLLQQMDGNYRRAINKWNPKLEDCTTETFLNILQESIGSLSNHGLNKKTLERLISIARERNQGRLIATSVEDNIVGVALVVWDNKRAYYLLAGNNKSFNKVYPGVLTAWLTIQFLKSNTNVKLLDFLGSDIDSIARIWRKIGAIEKSYLFIDYGSWLKSS